MTEQTLDLERRVARGEYSVDPSAVAEAILGRRAMMVEAARLSAMLVPLQLHVLAPGAD